ncbi:MAG TPA: hypothetical protein VKA48_06835, partial [Gammaproteobacteria bacterium]|nr:hypothetical protein [Gammaproteobacteria bacterium]
MQDFKRKRAPWALAVGTGLLAVGLAGCGGGGSSGSGGGGGSSVSGLKMPDQLSVTAAKDSSTTSGVATFSGALTSQSFPSGSAYNQDQTRSHTYDESTEPLSVINQILCMADQLQADKLVNTGPYVALVNEGECTNQGQNQSGAQTGGSGSTNQSKQLVKWVVKSTRIDNSSPQIVKIWKNAGQHSPQVVGRIEITESPSSTHPFGKFKFNFTGKDTGPNGTTVDMKGALKTVDNGSSKPQFKFITTMTDSNGNTQRGEAANVLFDNANIDTGEARTLSNYGTKAGYAVDFNTNYVQRVTDQGNDGTVDNTACLSRTNFTHNVWRYNLYYENAVTGVNGTAVSAGDRVKLKAGFPFVYTDNNIKHHGWIGYYGLWSETGSIPDSTTVTR